MTEFEKRPTQLLTSTNELRKLIVENPGLPLLVFAGEDCNYGDYSYMSCTNVRASLGEFLDCMQTVNRDYCYTDKDEFEEDYADLLADEFKGADEDFDAYVQEKVAEYAPYWKPCIIVFVDN